LIILDKTYKERKCAWGVQFEKSSALPGTSKPTGRWETVIGLEVHAELATKSKIYCGCTTEFAGEPNTHTCEICTGMPGALPVLNKKVVDYAIKAGLATNCSITSVGKQDRKNYFYPDNPKAYQTSQYDLPICTNGYLDVGDKRIGITRIHIEEDAGKLLHTSGNESLVDYNRCGVPLVEIVTEPDIRSAEEAKAFLEQLKSILEYTEVSDCKMQEGSLRCDVNVSVRPVGQAEYGTRTETKNLNSFRAAYRAIEYEVGRQISILENRGIIWQETRRWDDENSKSYTMRSKEQAHDYRYFPEPDLVNIVIDNAWIDSIRAELPELLTAKIDRYIKDYALSLQDALLLASTRTRADFFEEIVHLGINPKTAANILQHIDISDTTPQDVAAQIREKEVNQVSDRDVLLKIVKDVIVQNTKSVADYKSGKEKAIGFLVGQSMKLSKGQGNPQILNQLIKEQLQ
jgi:aspartyl-tRNA(Asn)/glutamyl-tRNA(Gln) amidotransferase subunit B